MAFKTSFQLQQHTPIVHFEHEQSGATIRGTELKAKFDRFLIEQFTLEKLKNFLIGDGSQKALDYKVRITDMDQNPIKGSTSLITKDDIGFWVKSKSKVKIEFFTFHPKLLELINDSIYSFLATTNFGKRQSKGWGCFYPDDNETDFETTLLSSGKSIFKFQENFQNDGDNFYAKVTEIWRLLKSGKNFRGDYRKALVFKYNSKKGFRWDKRLIKQELGKLIDDGTLKEDLKYDKGPVDSEKKGNECNANDRNSYRDWTDNENFSGEYRFVRAMLGMPEVYQFLTTDKAWTHQVEFKDSVQGEKALERFKSPVTFKIFNNNLYAIVEKIPDDLYGKEIKMMAYSKSKWDTTKKYDLSKTIKIPSKAEFNLEDFLNEYFPCVKMKKITKSSKPPQP
jgi:hypothetical protein